MGKKNKNKQQQQHKQNGGGNPQINGNHNQKNKSSQNNQQNQFKTKFQQQNKEREDKFVAQFEHRQGEKPAVLLKKEHPSSQHDNKNDAAGDRKKNKWRNDGESAKHVPVKQLANGNRFAELQKNQQKQTTTKRKALDTSDSSITSNEEDVETETKTANMFESIIKGNGDTKQRGVKRMKIDRESEDEDYEDEEVDNLEELAEEDDILTDDEDLEDEEFDSFICDDEELDEEEEDDSNDADFNLDILGYESVTRDTNCVVLQAKPDYSIATSAFCIHKFSDGDNSVQTGLKALQWILSPVDSQLFFSDIFQKRVLVVKRAASDYFEGFFSTKTFLEILQKECLVYGRDLNVASYENGIRSTHNPLVGKDDEIGSQRVYPAVINEHVAKGRSVQCVSPQTFDANIWYLCEVLQEVFCSFVGANNYLTPKNSAGFAPHWDDIDAFMVQVEGKKYWKIFAPENSYDTLPLESSRNFTDADFADRKPVFEGWLEQGDTLYVPRGFIHQAKTGPNTHSHHVTVSVCRRHSYADFFERASAEFIQTLTARSKQLRHSLPPLLFDMGGVSKLSYSNEESLDSKLLPVSDIVARKFGTDFFAFIPSFIDIMAKEFFKTALPPLLTPYEKEFSCIGGKNFDVFCAPFVFDSKTEVRLIRKHGQRLLFEDEQKAFIMHRMNNSRRYDDEAPGILFDFPIEFEDGYIKLADAYPGWIKLDDLGLTSLESNIKLAELLFNNCLLLRRESSGSEKTTVANKKNKMEAKKKVKEPAQTESAKKDLANGNQGRNTPALKF